MTSAPWLQPASATATKASPAYTTVTARRTLARPQEPPKPAATPKSVTWPQPVRDYVSRAFMQDNMIAGIDTVAISTKLKAVITQAAEKGVLESIDWTTYPLPQQLIQQESAGNMAHQTSHMNNSAVAHNGFHSSPPSGLKRKSPDTDMMDAAASSPLPPWRQSKNGAGLADRMTFLNKAQADRVEKRQKRAQEFRATAPTSKLSDLEKRRQRFENGKSGLASPYISSSRDDTPMPDANDGPVVGTCQKLEKNYFRLTAPPKPETVRPLHVLKEAAQMLLKKWVEEHRYGYICDQFKAVRQDLTVQHIKDDFTVYVYEAHARIALEQGDMGEYNQCQTQLRALYRQKLGGKPGEFLAYRILYFIYTCNRSSLNDVLADLTLTDKHDPAVKHALDVRSSLATGNYHRFFRLYNDCPNMGIWLMDKFVDRERLAALASICRSYKPDVKVTFLTEELAFEDDQQCAQFICDYGGETLLESRDDGPRFLAGKAGAFELFKTAKERAFGKVDIKGQI